MINLYNCDCMEFMKDVPDDYYELAIVDPPYGIGADINQKKRSSKKWSGKSGGQWKAYKETNWDNNTPDMGYFTELKRVSKNQIIWGGNYFNINENGVIIWDKGKNGTLPHGELAKTNIKTFKIFYISRADAYINNCDNKIHPTQKPVELYKWLLKNYAKEGDKIIDTHGGSMSIAIACHDMKFDLDLCELDKDYFEAGKKRLEKHQTQLNLFDLIGE